MDINKQAERAKCWRTLVWWKCKQCFNFFYSCTCVLGFFVLFFQLRVLKEAKIIEEGMRLPVNVSVCQCVKACCCLCCGYAPASSVITAKGGLWCTRIFSLQAGSQENQKKKQKKRTHTHDSECELQRYTLTKSWSQFFSLWRELMFMHSGYTTDTILSKTHNHTCSLNRLVH